MDLTFSINNQTLTRTDSIGIIGETVGQFTASFTFNSWWNDYDKTVQFSKLGKVYEILLTDNSCVIPWEVLTGGVFYVTVYATQGAQKIKTTNEVAVSVTSSGLNKDGFYSPTPEMYAQILSELDQKADKSVFTGNIEDISSGTYIVRPPSKIKVSQDNEDPSIGNFLLAGLLSVTKYSIGGARITSWTFLGEEERSSATITSIGNNMFYGTVYVVGDTVSREDYEFERISNNV